MRLIDADALTEIIHGMYAEGDDPSTYHVDAGGDTLIGKFAVVDTIFNMPTIQPKTGSWIADSIEFGGERRYKCSNCGYNDWLSEGVVQKVFKYCPNCGAKMATD